MATCNGYSQTIQNYRDSIQTIIQSLPSDSLKAQHYYSTSNKVLRQFGDFELVRQYIDSAMLYSQKALFTDSEAKCHFMYGLLNRLEGHYDSALYHLQINIDYFKNDPKNKSYALYQVGAVHSAQGDYKASLSTYLDILDLFEQENDSFAIASTLNSIANIYGKMGDNDEAISNYEEARSLFTLLEQDRDIALALNNIGEIYVRKSDTSTAKKYILESLEIAKKINDPHLIASALHHMGRTSTSAYPKQALKYYLEALELFSEIGSQSNVVLVHLDLAECYRNTGADHKAKIHLLKALELAKTINTLHSLATINKNLSEIYSNEKDFKNAFEHQLAYIRIKDSLFSIENTQHINLLKKQFETAQKDQALTAKNLEIQNQENAILKQETNNNIMIGIVVFLGLILLLIWFLFRQYRQQQNTKVVALKREYQIKTLESLIEGEETERLRIAKELHDGVNGDLSAIKFKLSALLEQNNTIIKEAIDMIDQSYNQVRAISHNLVPPSLEHFKLEEAIQTYCQNMNRIHKPVIGFQKIGSPLVLDKKAAINIFRIIQELVSNSLKHANANKIMVQISNQKGLTLITCEDDGSGFDTNTRTEGIGLKNIESRINYLRARIDLISNEKGTSYTIEIDNENFNAHQDSDNG